MAIIRGMTERLREAVNNSGMTHKQIGELVGMSESRLTALINGYGGCYASTFVRLCVVLDVSADWLMGVNNANFVEVVRCKDCNIPHNKWTGCPKLNGLIPPPDFYCGFGERKGGE